MADYTKAIAILILSFIGLMAPSALFASSGPVIDETFSEKPAEQGAFAAIKGTALAALEPVFDISLGGDTGTPGIVPPLPRITLAPDSTIVGTASFYEGAQETASGEQYDPAEFTAAAQLEIRDKFGGIRFGKNYQPAYAIGEFDGKKIIVKFNDVGPLKPGRKFDLSRAAMAYFDTSLEKGLLAEFKMTPLPLGQSYATGPVSDEQLVAMGIGYGDDALVTASIADKPDETEAPVAASVAAIEPPAVSETDGHAVVASPETEIAIAAPVASISDIAATPMGRIAVAFDDLYEQPGQNISPDAPASLDIAALESQPVPIRPEETRGLQFALRTQIG